MYRTGQRFGVNYIIDVLTGKDDARIQGNGHDRISTFGIGREHSALEWRNIMRQLIARGFLDIDADGHGAIRLTEKARPLLRGELDLQLRHQSRVEKKTRAKQEKQVSELAVGDQPLFESLRMRRLELARERGVPPYVIFHDITLREMASRRPVTTEALSSVTGVGDKKLERFGKIFIDVIRAHPSPR